MVVGVWPFAFAVADGTFESRFPERARFAGWNARKSRCSGRETRCGGGRCRLTIRAWAEWGAGATLSPDALLRMMSSVQVVACVAGVFGLGEQQNLTTSGLQHGADKGRYYKYSVHLHSAITDALFGTVYNMPLGRSRSGAELLVTSSAL